VLLYSLPSQEDLQAPIKLQNKDCQPQNLKIRIWNSVKGNQPQVGLSRTHFSLELVLPPFPGRWEYISWILQSSHIPLNELSQNNWLHSHHRHSLQKHPLPRARALSCQQLTSTRHQRD